MPVTNPPTSIQGGSHSAEEDRRFLTGLIGDVEGIHLATDLAVTERGTPNMSVDVAAGRCFVQGTEATFQGTYFCESRSVENLVVSAADATNPRNDLIVAQVEDSDYSGATDEWKLAVVTGTPAASPSDPATPDSAILLARVNVAALAASITDAVIDDLRTQANPGYALTTFAASGSFTKADYPWAKTIRVRLVGGGGGSGGCASTSSAQRAESAGGGGAGYAEKRILVSALASSETVTIGAGGTAAAAGNNTGGAGGTTSFGAHCSATGGNGGGGGPASSNVGNAGRGYRGIGSGGDINLPGGHGGNGSLLSAVARMGNWGGSSGGGLGSQTNATAANTATAVAGEPYGGGASGARNSTSAAVRAGGTGSVGIVLVEIFG